MSSKRHKNRSKNNEPKKDKPPAIPSPFASLASIKYEQPAAKVPEKELPPPPPPEKIDNFMASMFPDAVKIEDENYVPVLKKDTNCFTGMDEVDDLLELRELVDGDKDFSIEFLDEFVCGLAPGVDPRILSRLKNGEYSIQSYIDLHRFGWADSRQMILDFVNRSIASSYRCVLIIHGRGLHSRTQTPVIKENLVALLTRGPLRRRILGFSTALPIDGGPGSMYILLRRKR